MCLRAAQVLIGTFSRFYDIFFRTLNYVWETSGKTKRGRLAPLNFLSF